MHVVKVSLIINSILVAFSFIPAQDKKIELVTETDYVTTPSHFDAKNGMMTGGGMDARSKYYYKFEGETKKTELTYLGENLKAVLNPESGAVKQMDAYAGKRAGAIIGAVGFVVFAVLSATVGMEETGETTTKPDMNGNLETTNDRRVTGAGYTFIALSGVSGITGICCHVTRRINLENAVEMHNDFINKKLNASLSFNFEF